MSTSEIVQLLQETKLSLQQLQGSVISDPQTLEKIVKIRKFTCTEENPPLAQIIQSGICPLLIQQMDLSTQGNFIFEVLWILSNIASGNKTQTQYVLNIGGIATFLKYVSHQDEDVMAQALWGLGNIVGENSQFRDQVLNQNAVEIVLKQLERKNLKIANQRTICWVISNFSRGQPPPPYNIIKPCIPYFVKTMVDYPTDNEIWCDCLWGLNYITTLDEGTEDFVNSGHLTVICHRLKTHSESNEIPLTILSPLVRIIANISTGTNQDTDVLIQQDILPIMIELIKYKKQVVQQEIIRAISNIAAGTTSQMITLTQQPNLYENLMQVYNSTLKPSQKIKNEVLYVISNSFGKADALDFFAQKGAIDFMFNQLQEYLNESSSTAELPVRIIIEGLDECVSNALKKNLAIAQLDGKYGFLKSIANQIPEQMKKLFRDLFKKVVEYQKSQPSFEALAGQLEDLVLDDDELEKEFDEENDDDEEISEEEDSNDAAAAAAGVGTGAGAGAGPAAPMEDEDASSGASGSEDEDDDDDEEESNSISELDKGEEELVLEIESTGGMFASAAPS